MAEAFDPAWEPRCERFVSQALAAADAAHDMAHIRRVVAAARKLATTEGAELAVVMPAAWLHDCVIVPKDSPDRARASGLAAETARAWLAEQGYPERHLDAIAHAIEAHSFSAGIPPETPEARVVQDADRLDALGAIGLARCLATGVAMGGRIYDEADPFARQRPLDDRRFSIDHLPNKLLKLPATMQTDAGRAEAHRRAEALTAFLIQLADELGLPAPDDWLAVKGEAP